MNRKLSRFFSPLGLPLPRMAILYAGAIAATDNQVVLKAAASQHNAELHVFTAGAPKHF